MPSAPPNGTTCGSSWRLPARAAFTRRQDGSGSIIQPSRRIGKLESLLSVKLLDRSRKGIAVREEAQATCSSHIEQMDMQASSLEDAVTRTGAEPPQTVRIATMEGLASRYLARRLPALFAIAAT